MVQYTVFAHMILNFGILQFDFITGWSMASHLEIY